MSAERTNPTYALAAFADTACHFECNFNIALFEPIPAKLPFPLSQFMRPDSLRNLPKNQAGGCRRNGAILSVNIVQSQTIPLEANSPRIETRYALPIHFVASRYVLMDGNVGSSCLRRDTTPP